MKLKPIFHTGRKFLFSKTNQVKLKNVIAGIALALIPVIIVLIVSEGMIYGITQRFVEISSYHYQVKKYTNFNEDEIDRVAAMIKKVDKVTGVYKERQESALFSFNHISSGVAVRGIQQSLYDDEKFREFLNVDSGEFDVSQDNYIVVSSDLAKKTGIVPGSKVKLLTTKIVRGRTPILRPVSFTVKAIVSSGYYELDSLTVYISYNKAIKLFMDTDSFIGIKKENPETDDKTFEDEVDSLLYKWYLSHWKDINATLLKSYESIKITLLIIMTVIILVAAINILSSVFMLAKEKYREIAILKSYGITKYQIAMIFSVMGLGIGLSGVLIGLAAGLFLGVNINTLIYIIEGIINVFVAFINILTKPFSDTAVENVTILSPSFYLEKIPVIIKLDVLIFYSSLTIFLSFIAGLIPGLKAGAIKPVEIFNRH